MPEIDALSHWLQPLPDQACGPDLEYDAAFLTLVEVVGGRPESQFAAGEAPDWNEADRLAQDLLARTRDLRVAAMWSRAAVSRHGLEGLAPSLALLGGLLDRFWEGLHPLPDLEDREFLARLSALKTLASAQGLLGDLRRAPLLPTLRQSGPGPRMRDVELALARLEPAPGEQVPTPVALEAQLAASADAVPRLQQAVTRSLEALDALQSVMDQRFGAARSVDLAALRGMLEGLRSLLPAPATPAVHPAQVPRAEPTADTAPVPLAGHIQTRLDAVRAIHAICAYLERQEPTNPAQLLLRRAERLIDKGFLHLMRDLAPDAVNEVARILGVDPKALA